jgi:hypothetical protein
LEAPLRRITAYNRQIRDLDSEINTRQRQLDLIAQDQNRVRENMKALKGSAEEKQLVQRYTKQLNDQEDEVISLRGMIQKTTEKREAIRAEMNKVANEMSADVEMQAVSAAK